MSRRTVLLVLLCLALTAVDVHFVGTKVRQGFFDSVKATQGVLDGLPHWRIYQSRVLGPYVSAFLAGALRIPLGEAVLVFGAACLLAARLLVVFHRRRDDSAVPTLFMLLAGSLAFAFYANEPYLYPWDFFGILAFTALVVFALEGRSWRWFVPLALVAFLNRESAAFLCLWMVLHALIDRDCPGGLLRERPDRALLAAGAGTLVVGLLIVHFLRESLLVREVGPELFGIDPAGTGLFQWKLGRNLGALGRTMSLRYVAMPWLLLLVPFATMVAAVVAGLRFPRHRALCATFLLLIAAVFLFGELEESRVMMETVPFLAVFLPSLAFAPHGPPAPAAVPEKRKRRR